MALLREAMPDPSWPLTLVCVGALLSLAPLPSPRPIYGGLVAGLLVLCLNRQVRGILRYWAKAAIALLSIAAVLAISRILANHGGYGGLESQVLRLARLLIGL